MRVTYQWQSLKKLFYAYKEMRSPEISTLVVKKSRWYDEELDELIKSVSATSEDFNRSIQKLSKASSYYKSLIKDKVFLMLFFFADDELCLNN